MKKILLAASLLAIVTFQAKSQSDLEPVNAGVANFLTITPDARAAGMGGAALTLPGGGNAVFHNASTVLQDDMFVNELASTYKLILGARTPKATENIPARAGISYNYTPCMRDFASGYHLHAVGGYYKIGSRHAILAGFRYYDYPGAEVLDAGVAESVNPREFALELGYAYRIISPLTVSTTLRYIRSDMGSLNGAKAGDAVAFDMAASYRQSMNVVHGASWGVGVKLSNIGTKIKYLETKESIPAVVALGGSVYLPFSVMHKLTVATDLAYRLSPSDVKTLGVSAGAEYTFINHFMARGGYHYGEKEKADFSYATAGIGVKYFGGQVDFSWLFAEKDNPWRNTFRISLGYSF